MLPEEAPVGASLPEAVAIGERVLEVGITPNRGDAASVVGVGARDGDGRQQRACM